MFLLSSSESR